MRTSLLALALVLAPVGAMAAEHSMASHAMGAAQAAASDTATQAADSSMSNMMKDSKMKEMCDKMQMAPAAAAPGVTDYYGGANAKMHHDMMVTPTGDADVDFVRGMIPHHQGAVDMAKVLLEHGKDAELHKMAEGIIKAQESEIAFMNDWLKKHDAK